MFVAKTALRSALLAAVLGGVGTLRAQGDEPSLEQGFSVAVRPFLETYCVDCHGKEKPEAQLDLGRYVSLEAVAADHRTFKLVLDRLEAGEMPPEDSPHQPTAEERKGVVAWIRAARARDARLHAGDPGQVLARRLSNFELDCTVRDLTAVDMRPTRQFPVDPANEAGFDNSGESLAMSPALLKKYLDAARFVADHVVLKPDGFGFAPHVVASETDRDKYCVARIVDFYRSHAVDYADYFFVAWRSAHPDPNEPAISLSDLAARSGLSLKYVTTVLATLNDPSEESGPLADLRAQWRQLPGDPREADGARRGCQAMRDWVIETRKKYVTNVDPLPVKGISRGSQPAVLWRNRQWADRRMRYEGDAAADRFCRVFPDAFYVAERPPYFDPNGTTRGRLLTAGFHLMQGYFRDDGPLCELVLDDQERRELDTLWRELNFVTDAPRRQYKDFIFFERAEPPRFASGDNFDFARSEDKDTTSPAKIERLRLAYLTKARELKNSEVVIEAIEHYFTTVATEILWVDRARAAAEASHLSALARFAERAYRRPLLAAERDDLLAFYWQLRERDGIDHENALRDVVASVLLSPDFCYQFAAPQSGASVQPLTDYELASRLSYFLWSSMPDDELLSCAQAGTLRDPQVLVDQVRRMLRDDRVRGLAIQFAGNLLDFRRFDEHNGVDRERFATFTNELRQAMYEEPIRFFVALAAKNGSVLDLLYGDYTYVDTTLAHHYGVPEAEQGADGWWRLDDAGRYGRGGLLPMSVFLTKNSPGLRTSPVKRGYWVVRRLLGERIPSPPPEVPELPKDEAQLGDLTLPELLARHRQQKSCAACHERFDSIGLVFEGYGPIGERRERDLSGHPIDDLATFRDGASGSGLDGLRRYLRQNRQGDFLDNLCRKLLVYALGRGLLPSDDPLVDNMRVGLAADGYRFGGLVEAIVTSSQFLNKRGRE
ncbi:MAG TPA: DUF1592 domain-containing protein [Pirellulales bacterium]|nr:DUF1592 domain-containing protein [Pirellulales bacterium]